MTEELGEGIGGGEGNDHQPDKAGVEQSDGKQDAGKLAREGFDGEGSFFSRGEGDPVHKKRGGGGHHQEESHEVGDERPHVSFDLREFDLGGINVLVEGEAADEELPPGGDHGADHAHADEQVTAQVLGGEFHAVRVRPGLKTPTPNPVWL